MTTENTLIEGKPLNPYIGQVVNYVLASGTNKGDIRPAIIVRTWSETCVQLQVFTDSTNDFPEGSDGAAGIMWKTSVMRDDEQHPHTWHPIGIEIWGEVIESKTEPAAQLPDLKLSPNLIDQLGIYLTALEIALKDISEIAGNTVENVQAQVMQEAISKYSVMSDYETHLTADNLLTALKRAFNEMAEARVSGAALTPDTNEDVPPEVSPGFIEEMEKLEAAAALADSY